jgi:hypothetical protein
VPAELVEQVIGELDLPPLLVFGVVLDQEAGAVGARGGSQVDDDAGDGDDAVDRVQVMGS